MADAHSGHAAHAEQNLFPQAEWESFQADDLDAARHIIYLMAGIFTLGLGLYTVVCLVVAS